MSDSAYCYPPDYRVLRNRFELRDQRELAAVEREFVAQRLLEPLPMGDFDLAHLMSIHRHLFQDVYEWAGKIRTVEISKDDNQFQFRRFIEIGMADIHRRLARDRFLKELGRGEFAQAAGHILGDINYVHPFREGNGRTQLVYLLQLSEQAGHPLDLTRIDKKNWMNASRDAHHGDYTTMSQCIEVAITANQRSPRH